MVGEWLAPVLAWLGIGIVPFFLMVIAIILFLRG